MLYKFLVIALPVPDYCLTGDKTNTKFPFIFYLTKIETIMTKIEMTMTKIGMTMTKIETTMTKIEMTMTKIETTMTKN